MTAQPIPSLSFDSSTLPAAEQFAAQQKFMRSFAISTANPEAGFFARSTAWMVDGVVVNIGNLGPLDIERDKAMIRTDSVNHYVAAVMIEGAVWDGSFDGLDVRVDPGEIVILDMTRPMRTTSGAGTTIVLMIPRLLLDEAMPPFDVHGLVLDAPGGRLLTDYLMALVTRLPTLEAAEAPGIARGTRDLLAATLATARRSAADPALTAVLLRAKRHIAANLGGDLSADALATALGVSRATVFRTFEPMGGLEGFVRGRRLARAHEMLTRTDSPHTIAQIAYTVGFKTAAHFSHAFREAYGYTATDLQAGRAGWRTPLCADTDVHRVYEQWSDGLR